MDELSRQYYSDLKSNDPNVRYEGYKYLMKETQNQVDWTYEVWDDLVELTRTGDNHERAIATQLLTNLAKSDPQKKIIADLDKIIAVTKDEKFVTARHTIQSLWKIGVISKEMQELIISHLTKRYEECVSEKNYTLIRYDILENFRKIFDQFRDETVKARALDLIAKEIDPKYQKKYTGLWKRS
ncbi:MAG: hypothetical protein ABWZ25_08440 [Chitinophagaceae bacterium]